MFGYELMLETLGSLTHNEKMDVLTMYVREKERKLGRCRNQRSRCAAKSEMSAAGSPGIGSLLIS